jgi:hypothetical protein
MGFISKEMAYGFVLSDLEQMSRYIKAMELAIHDNLQQTIADIGVIAKDMNEEENSDFYISYEDELIELRNIFPELLFSSFAISWYSFVEHELIHICEILKLRISISIKDNFRYGEGIERAYKFLIEARNYRIENNHWEELNKIRKIRNMLVHQKGILLPKPFKCKPSVRIDLAEDEAIYLPIDEELYRYLCKHNLYHTGNWRITFSYGYCVHLVDFGKELLKKIYEDLILINPGKI